MDKVAEEGSVTFRCSAYTCRIDGYWSEKRDARGSGISAHFIMGRAWVRIRSWTRIKVEDGNESEEGDEGRHGGEFKPL